MNPAKAQWGDVWRPWWSAKSTAATNPSTWTSFLHVLYLKEEHRLIVLVNYFVEIVTNGRRLGYAHKWKCKWNSCRRCFTTRLPKNCAEHLLWLLIPLLVNAISSTVIDFSVVNVFIINSLREMCRLLWPEETIFRKLFSELSSSKSRMLLHLHLIYGPDEMLYDHGKVFLTQCVEKSDKHHIYISRNLAQYTIKNTLLFDTIVTDEFKNTNQ